MEGKFEEPSDPAAGVPRQVRGSPNVSRVQDSLREEDRRATRLVSPSLIRPSPYADRLDVAEDLDELIKSIRERGQQVPILVRRLASGELEVVYGRRRLLACAAIGVDVRATVLEMTDEEALIAQGVENSQRLDTSFIEKALFVNRILGAGFSTAVVHTATGVNDTLIYRMRGIVQAIPESVIRAIGPAHGAGRRQWDVLASFCKSAEPADIERLQIGIDAKLPSGERLTQALAMISGAKGRPAPASPALVRDTVSLSMSARRLTLSTPAGAGQGFLLFLTDRLPDLVDEWKKQVGDKH